MRIAAIVLGIGLALVACNKQPQVNEKDASAEEIAKKVRENGGDQAFVRPGLWESNVTIEKFDVPGMPADMAQRLKTMMAEDKEHGFQTCLTAEDVKRPKEDFFAGKDNQCRYEHFTMGNGKIDAAMRCGGKEGGTQVMQMAGTYSPESYQMQTSIKMEGRETPQGAITMAMRVEAQRIGECKAGQS